MSNASEWSNKMRRASTDALHLFNTIDALFAEAKSNANIYHELKYTTKEPPETPPAASQEEKVKQWLVDEGAVGEFPAITEDDLWLLALVLNSIVGDVSDVDYERLFRTAI